MKKYYVFLILSGLFISGCKKDRGVSPIGPNTFAGTIRPREFLSDEAFTKLVIEIDYVTGYAPSQTSINNIVSFLQNIVNKPDGIVVNLTEIPSSGKQTLTLDDVRAIEKSNRNFISTNGVLTLYVLVTDGAYYMDTSTSKVLGVAYAASSLVLFEKTIRDLSGGVGQPSVTMMESTTGEHEMGHILGLVNFGTPMVTPHADPQNPQHCNNTRCLMYFETENSDFMMNLAGNIPTLDDNCKNDLRANGGK